MDIFLKREAPPQEEPQGRSFRGCSEKGFITIGDDSSVHVIAPEDLPVGQAMEVKDTDTDADTDPVCVFVFNKKVLKVKKIQ